MDYKPSKYTMRTTTADNAIVMYNSLYKTIRKYCHSLDDKITHCLETGSSEDASLFNDLLRHGFITNADYDESAYARSYFLRYRSNPDLLLTILPTMSCNFNCPYCYEKNEATVMSKEIQSALIKFVKKNISKYTGIHLSWFGGEPLMTKDIVAMPSENDQMLRLER